MIWLYIGLGWLSINAFVVWCGWKHQYNKRRARKPAPVIYLAHHRRDAA